MAFSLGSLLATASQARAGAKRGVREERQIQDTAVRQRELDMFNEYARRRQLDQTDEAQGLRGELAASKNRSDIERAQLLADVNRYRTDQQYGQGGSVDRTIEGRGNVAGMQYGPGGAVDRTNNSREDIADGRNRTQITIQTMPQRLDPSDGQPKPIPAATRIRISDGLTKSLSSIRDLEDAIQATNGVKDYTGPWDNFRDTKMEKYGQKINPERARARAAYAKVITPIITGQFGAALTKLERDYIAPYAEQLANATEARIPIILGLIKTALEQAREEQMHGLETQGFDTEPYRNIPARPAAGATASPSGKRPLSEMPR